MNKVFVNKHNVEQFRQLLGNTRVRRGDYVMLSVLKTSLRGDITDKKSDLLSKCQSLAHYTCEIFRVRPEDYGTRRRPFVEAKKAFTYALTYCAGFRLTLHQCAYVHSVSVFGRTDHSTIYYQLKSVRDWKELKIYSDFMEKLQVVMEYAHVLIEDEDYEVND